LEMNFKQERRKEIIKKKNRVETKIKAIEIKQIILVIANA